MKEREREIEDYLVHKIQELGGIAWKFVSPGRAGVPDRWCVLRGMQFFVELKAPNAKPRPDERRQDYRARQLSEQGCLVFKISSRKEVDELIRLLQSEADFREGTHVRV